MILNDSWQNTVHILRAATIAVFYRQKSLRYKTRNRHRAKYSITQKPYVSFA